MAIAAEITAVQVAKTEQAKRELVCTTCGYGIVVAGMSPS